MDEPSWVGGSPWSNGWPWSQRAALVLPGDSGTSSWGLFWKHVGPFLSSGKIALERLCIKVYIIQLRTAFMVFSLYIRFRLL